MQLMLQATVCDCLALDPFAFEEDGLGSSEVDVGWREIAQALVIAGMVVMSHEGRDLAFEIAGQVIVLEQDAVLERLMPALDLAEGRRACSLIRPFNGLTGSTLVQEAGRRASALPERRGYERPRCPRWRRGRCGSTRSAWSGIPVAHRHGGY